jgi:TrmH family RNA methyltransferase
MKKLGQSREYRRECGEFLCDGKKLLDEALKNGAQVTCVFTVQEIDIPTDTPSYLVPQELIDSVSPMKSPQNVLFSCRMPEPADLSSGGRHIVLENIQDPGNVGTVIRTAGAFYIDSVILVGACADPYNPKTVRATMGAIFRQKVIETDYDGLDELKMSGVKLYGAYLGENCRDVRDADLNSSAVCIGSEGRGLTEKLLNMCDENIIIPMNPLCESLNAAVAASVMMWEMTRNDRG